MCTQATPWTSAVWYICQKWIAVSQFFPFLLVTVRIVRMLVYCYIDIKGISLYTCFSLYYSVEKTQGWLWGSAGAEDTSELLCVVCLLKQVIQAEDSILIMQEQ